MSVRRRAYLLVVVAAGFVACGDEGELPRDTVRDSAGVRIVENADADVQRLWAVGEPALVLGEEDDENAFGLVADLAMLEDGSLVVADALDRRVRFFDGGGREVASVGRRGEGPGEFESIDRLWLTGADRVAVWDGRLLRYTELASDGAIDEPVRLEATAERARHSPVGLLPDGRLVAVSDDREIPSLERYRARLSVLRFDADGSVADTIARVPGADMWDWVWEGGVTPALMPFGRSTTVQVDGDVVWVGANEGYQLDRYDLSGALQLRIRLHREAASLEPATVEAYKADERAKAQSSQVAKGGNDLFGRMAEAATYPERHPHYDEFLVDDVGNVWVLETLVGAASRRRATVLSRDGDLLGRAELPAPFRPRHVRGNRVAGVWRDPLGVEHVRVYVFVAGEDPG